MKFQLPNDLREAARRLDSVLDSPSWNKLVNQFNESEEIFLFGNGGNLAILCHWVSDFKSAGIRKRFTLPAEMIHFSKCARESSPTNLFCDILAQETVLTSCPLIIAVGSNSDSKAIMNLISSEAFPKFQKTLITFSAESAGASADVNHIDLGSEFYHQGEIALMALGYELIRSQGRPLLKLNAQF